MTVQLTQLGEHLVARMLTVLSERGDLGRVRCAASGVALVDDLAASNAEFWPERARVEVSDGQNVYPGDGAQRVDVLAVAEVNAVPMELKLGLTRMTSKAFAPRYCGDVTLSGHRKRRINGSMVAVLERRFPFQSTGLFGVVDERRYALTTAWWLVVREPVWKGWVGGIPARFARLLVFDELARQFGGPKSFDSLVHQVLGKDFAARWGVRLNS